MSTYASDGARSGEGASAPSRRDVLCRGTGLAVGALAIGGQRAQLASAQTATPGATPAAPMSTAETEALLRQYLAVLVGGGDFGQFYADDIVVTLEDTDQVVHGRTPSIQAITDLHRVAFTARPEIGPLVVGPGVAGLEVVFVGTHTGTFAGVPATGRSVRVPYAVFYGIGGGKITALRIYGLVAGLILQITAKPGTATPAA